MAGPAASAGPSGGSSRWYRPVHGFHPHKPLLRHRLTSKLMGGTMFFFIFYRAYHDGPALLGRHPWDGHHGHGEHGHGDNEHH